MIFISSYNSTNRPMVEPHRLVAPIDESDRNENTVLGFPGKSYIYPIYDLLGIFKSTVLLITIKFGFLFVTNFFLFVVPNKNFKFSRGLSAP